MSTHNLCFGAKIRKIGIPCIPQFCKIKVGFKGVYFYWTCFPDVEVWRQRRTNYVKHHWKSYLLHMEIEF